MSPPPPVRPSRLAGFALLFGLAFVWGLNWPAMKVVLADLPVLTFRVICLWTGGPILLLLCIIRGETIAVPREERWPLVVVALFNITIWHVGAAAGIPMIGAGRASIVAFTMPVWTALFSAALLREWPDSRVLAGLALGVGGLFVLTIPAWERFGAAPLGVALVLAAAVSWGLGTVLTKRHRWSPSIAALTGWQLTLGGVPIAIAAGIVDPRDAITGLSATGAIVLGYVILLPMVFAQWAWFKVLSVLPANIASISVLAVPVVGVLSGALLLGEPIGWSEASALLMIVTALGLVLVLPASRAGPSRSSSRS